MRTRLVEMAIVALGLASGPASAEKRYSAWSTPMALDAVNTAELEFANGVSRDGLSFYFQRGDAAVSGEDIWVVHRDDKHAPWGTPERLPDTVNSGYNDRAAFVSSDGHWLFFASDRPGGRGGFDLMVSWRPHVHDDFGWEAAQNLDDLGSAANSPGFDSGPAIFQDEESGLTYLYLVSNPAGPQNNAVDIYVSIQDADGFFGPPSRVEELSDPSFNEGRPYVRHDGLEIFFQSNRTGSLGGPDIWASTRATTGDAWSTPQRVDVVSTAGQDVTPVLSWDGRTLFFASNRTGTPGQIFFSTRERVHGRR